MVTHPVGGSESANDVVIEARGLKKYFPVRRGVFSRVTGHVRAVDGVSFRIGERETLGLVGESGCGKTTLGRALLRLLEPTAGEVLFRGKDLTRLSGRALRETRRHLQIVFQDPYGSLNPRMTVEAIVGEGLAVHGIARGGERRRLVEEVLDRVGLSRDALSRYPHEFSGGQRQRVAIARAVSLSPDFIVCDEPVSALDVSIQAQIINLLEDLREELGLSYLFISHDLSVVEHISRRVAVMYLGRIVETAGREALYRNPLHPYTRALLEAIPSLDPKTRRKRIILGGDVPSPLHPPAGCPFHPRCPRRMEVCPEEAPTWREVEPGHLVACHLYDRT